MARISKRLRFEVFRRDDHRCRHCGTTPEENELVVDHVVPVALGGTDDPSNLVTSCVDCNAGKSAVAPDQALVQQVSDDALRWAAAMKIAAQLERDKNEPRREFIAALDEEWNRWNASGAPVPRPASWRNGLGTFFDAGLETDTIAELIEVAMSKQKVAVENKWKYFCGAAWNVIKARQDIAKGLIEADDPRISWIVGEIPEHQKTT